MTRLHRRKSVAQSRLSLEFLEGRDVPATGFALGTGANANTLFRFDTATPQTIQATTAITGLIAGDTIIGTDFRPSNGQFYGVGVNDAANSLQVYTINPFTGAATAVFGPIQLVDNIGGAASWGVDFNPVSDRIRVVNDLASDGAGGNANNIRLHPDTGALVAVDADLDFTALPNGNADAPEVAVAYMNSELNPTPPATTQLFGIISGGDALVTNGGAGPDFNDLTSIGALGVTLSSNNAGLDIVGTTDSAFAVLQVGGATGFYTMNLTTGAATLVNTIGDGTPVIADVSIAPALGAATVTGVANGQVQLLPAVAGTLTVGAAITVFPGINTVVRSTTADVNNDGTDDLIAVTGPGTPIRVTVLSGVDNSVLVTAFDPFGGNFTGGGFVTAGDIDADGRAEFVVTPDQGGGPRVSIFSLAAAGTTATVRANFLGIDDPNFRGGARSALGDVNNDGTIDLAVSAGFLGGPRTAIFNGTSLLANPTRLVNDFFAFPGTDAVTLRNGVFVSMSDINGDGFDDVIFGGGPGGAPRVFILSGQTISTTGTAAAQAAPIANFFVAGNTTDRGGVRVSGANLDGDTVGDLIVGSGEGSAARVRAYSGVNFTTTGEPTVFQDVTVFGGAVLPGGVYVG